MKNIRYWLLGSTISVGLILSAHSAQALTVTVNSITPEATDITDMIGGGPGGDIVFNGWLTTEAQEYVVEYTVDEQPAVVINPGGTIEVGDVVYDESVGTLTVTFTATGIITNTEQTFSVLAMIGAVAEGEDGPPAEMRGAFMSTNVEEWELVPPSPGNPAFGFILSGPEGEEGFFRMLIPDAIVDLLSQFTGETLTGEDLAVVMDDQIASLSITDVDGGFFVDINVTFEENNTEVASVSADDTVTREVVVEQQPVLSLALEKQVAKGSSAELNAYLNLASGKNKGKTLALYRKRGKDEYMLISEKTVKQTNGSVAFKQKVTSKTDKYKVKYKAKGKTAKVSNVVTVEAK